MVAASWPRKLAEAAVTPSANPAYSASRPGLTRRLKTAVTGSRSATRRPRRAVAAPTSSLKAAVITGPDQGSSEGTGGGVRVGRLILLVEVRGEVLCSDLRRR